MSNQWIEIKVKHSGKCIGCGNWLMFNQNALWKEGVGIKCIECPVPLIEDKSQLIIIDNEDKELLGIK